MARVAFEHITKRFGHVVAVDDLSLEVFDEEFLVLLGPSGCGKSTALRMIAGLEEPSEGQIWIGDEVVNDIEPKDRDVAMVFQTYALYPHMTVARNIEFPLKSRGVTRERRSVLVRDAARTLGLDELLDRKPAQLSGGQRQRVALARAIVRHPQVFLMDEPLSNLDAKLRVQTRADLIELQQRLQATVIYVTHDQVEAMTMGHRIAIMKDGVLQQVGPPQEVYESPANLFVAGFIGTPPMNIIPGESMGAVPSDVTQRDIESITIGVRPEHVVLGDGRGLPAHVTMVESLGHERNVGCRLGDGTLVIARQDVTLSQPSIGESVHLAIVHSHMHVFDNLTGDRIDA